ncbi:Cell division protein FtsI (Peptidoglycan synthetase) [Candidatus Hydrogenisulfobacillus filiaventi]|uniref:Cell division protein FtsI (Peptidoglycan synthetase) n=1 Tax=Candidatus Hydrogenisulfobacillus filiaventi TaxID=2707344 RepID=A0A6F8ZFL9_9FIRM|nr:penicillin-binding protein 2 [Bacillota bacterium]CAB1128460.1 Cell division protein FtsI (Peptidoglycan synthetase) [Candidatus Hydrogenisulfobacillus filiaventi]
MARAVRHEAGSGTPPAGSGLRWRLGWTRFWWMVGFGLLGVQLVRIQVLQAPALQAYALGIHYQLRTLPAERGKILDRFGQPLAMDVPGYDVIATPHVLAADHPRRAARALARVLPFPAARIAAVIDRRNSWYALLARDVSPATARKVAALNLPGVSLEAVSGRDYPDGSLAAQVLGFVGSGDRGLAGVEAAYNRWLAGTPGRERVAVDAYGQTLPQWSRLLQAPRPGDSVELTIDPAIQAVAQHWLDWGVKRVHANGGTVIILNPHTGAVLALANAPTFNPNRFWTAKPQDLVDQAVQDPVPPGSIFKPVTVSAALNLGLVTPDTLFDTRGYKIVDGVRIDDWKPGGWGWITLTRGLAYSSDQVFMDLALKLGVAHFYRYVRRFGFFHPSGVGLPGDSNGVWLPASQVNAVDLATMGFGQGMAVTPMQVVAAVATVVNHGVMMQPRIVRAIIGPGNRVVRRYGPRVESRPVAAGVAAEVEGMMVKEATYGTGVPADLPGYIIGGKTGTAQQIVHGRTSNHVFVSSYLGFGPYPHPRFLMLVMINHPRGALFYGDQVAAPVWQKIGMFLMHYWHIAPYAGPHNGGG